MDLLEYQGKQFFASFDIPVSPGEAVTTVDEAVAVADRSLREGIDYAHRKGANVLVALNTYPQPGSWRKWQAAVDRAAGSRPGATEMRLWSPKGQVRLTSSDLTQTAIASWSLRDPSRGWACS